MIQSFAKSHIGQRKVNEDKFLVDEELGLYIVADGVGGLDKGEVASQLTCDLIYKSVKQGLSLVDAIEATHQLILLELKSNKQKKGMASTVVAALFNGNSYEIAWVGDSRAYLWDGELKLITRDHSYLELLFVNGHITIDEFKDHPSKNIISQALGIERKAISVATNHGTLEKGQKLLLATDGLYEVVKEKNMIQQLIQVENTTELTTSLVDLAVQAEGKDNITLLTIQSQINTVNLNNIRPAKVVRIFDAQTGDATECENKNIKAEKKQPVSHIKVATPRVLNTEEAVNVKPIIHESKFMETTLLIMIVVAILVTITLNM